MKKTRILAVVLSLCMLLALVPVAALADFTDIDEATNENYADAIERWSGEGVISGVGNDTFDPKGTMTRVQGFGIIANLLNLTEKADLSEYTDVPADGWKADYLAKVVAAGIVTGYPDKTLRPEGELTREQMFVTIAKTLGVQPVETDDEEFEDIGEAADYAAPYINALHKMGAVNGSNGNVNPLDILNRESAALLLDNLIGGYANTEGETVEIEKGKITLVVADNVAVTGEITEEDMPIVVAGQAGTVDMKEVTGDVAPTVNVTVPEVKIENAPVGTTVAAAEDVTDVTVNDQNVAAGGEVVVPEPEPEPTPVLPPYVDTTNYAKKAADDAWNALKELLTTKGVNVLIQATEDSNGNYTLTLDADAIKADNPAFAEGTLDNLMGNIKKAIDDNFGTATLNIKVADDGDPVPVYANQKFDNTNLKAALVYVADGFFYKLSKLDTSNGTAETVYEYKTLTGTVVNGTQSAPVSLAIKLKGEDVKKVQALADKLEKYLSMEQMSESEIAEKYGTISGLSGESEYIVVGVDMPESVMTKLKAVLTDKDTFEGKKVSEMFAYLEKVEIGEVLQNDKDNLNSLFTTINSNANLINKVLGKMTITINGKSVTTNFDPSVGSSAWKKFVHGVGSMFGSGAGTVGDTTVGSYAVTGGSLNGQGYYAVPVKVEITLPSMEFTATETILVVLHIPYPAA